MLRRFAFLALLPHLLGCVTVNRYSLFDAEGFGMAASDAGVTGTLLTVAACSGLIGGIAVWLGFSFLRRRVRSDA